MHSFEAVSFCQGLDVSSVVSGQDLISFCSHVLELDLDSEAYGLDIAGEAGGDESSILEEPVVEFMGFEVRPHDSDQVISKSKI